MQSFFTLPTALTDRLEALEEELGLPINIVNATSNPLPSWSSYFRPDPEALTIVSWGIPAERYHWREWSETPEAWLNEAHADEGPSHDFYSYDIPALSTNGRPDIPLSDAWEPYAPLNDGASFEAVFVSERMLCFNLPLNNMIGTMYNVLDFEAVFVEPLCLVASENYIEQASARREEAMTRRWREWAGDSRTRVLTDIRRRVAQQEAILTSHQETVLTAQAELQQLGAQAESLEARAHMSNEDLDTLLEKVKQHPRITDVEFNIESALVLTTDTVTMTHPAFGSRTMGRYKITLIMGGHTEGAQYSIRIQNLDYPRNGRHHPHVPSNGQPCWGDASATIGKYLTEMRLIPLIEMLFMYLESFNPEDDYGRFAAWWYDEPDALEQAEQEAAAEAVA